MKRVLLAAMRSPFLDSDRVYPPLGILYLKSALQKEGFECDVTDDFDPTHPEKYSQYDLFGASVMTPQREQAHEFVTTLKQAYPDKMVIIGGPHAKHYVSECLKEPWDHVVVEDGERVIPLILQGFFPGSQRIIHDKIR